MSASPEARPVQLPLISGYYRCHNCQRTVERVRKTGRFWLCAECWQQIMPDWEQVETEAQRQRIAAYWEWYSAMERRYPLRGPGPLVARSRTRLYFGWMGQPPDRAGDMYWPLCECGAPREPMSLSHLPPGLFGGPFRRWCAICDAKRTVESTARLAANIHPDWDDEDWLDFLHKAHPRLFALDVLPDYWFELRGTIAVSG